MDPADATFERRPAGFERRPAGRERWPEGWHVTVVASTGSTNADLLAAVAADAPDRSVLIARHQTAGRGRLDRRWEAPPGSNLLMSVLFRRVDTDPHLLVQRLALAARSVAATHGVPADLKWPNDLLVADRKLAGVLAEARPEPGATPGSADLAVVVGIGLNIGWAPEGAARLGDDVDPLVVAAAVLEAYDLIDPASMLDEYRAHLATIGCRVRVELATGTPDAPHVVEGRALDVESDGRLVVLDDCAITHRFSVGDVVHLR
jgi:BirA family biotin operon repressor/biotin-[acetyl-CoA-carboxylase] ligase